MYNLGDKGKQKEIGKTGVSAENPNLQNLRTLGMTKILYDAQYKEKQKEVSPRPEKSVKEVNLNKYSYTPKNMKLENILRSAKKILLVVYIVQIT